MPFQTAQVDARSNAAAEAESRCAHCGEPLGRHPVYSAGKGFCCDGCRIVSELLAGSPEQVACDLPELAAGRVKLEEKRRAYAYLDRPEIEERLLEFREGDTCALTLFIPAIHCSSCIWVLEHLYRFREGITTARVNFLRKELYVVFDRSRIRLRELVSLLAALGYPPRLQLEQLERPKAAPENRRLYLRLGVAGFAFGNIMLLRLPDYLAFESFAQSPFRSFFGYVSLLLALPVLLYSSLEYFHSAWAGLRHRVVNIDVPISIGILVLFARSAFEILTHSGGGYLDSFTGLVFFLLIGKVFQQKSYAALSFERDFRAYFPIAVTVRRNGREEPAALPELRPGDEVVLRNGELIPADGVLVSGEGWIDYSFVTGESRLVKKVAGERVLAGGRQRGAAIRVRLEKAVSQSYLTSLWNRDLFRRRQKSRLVTLSDTVAKYFTAIVLTIASGSFFYWLPQSHALAWNALTAVLIVACPCALALSIPFAFGNALRHLGRWGLFVKNTDVVEALARVDTLVFDKTGTLTEQGSSPVSFHSLDGSPLTEAERERVAALARQSTHPLSMEIARHLGGKEKLQIADFEEKEGAGVRARIAGSEVRLGALRWVEGGVAAGSGEAEKAAGSRVWLSVDGRVRGWFALQMRLRREVAPRVEALKPRYRLAVLSGDFDFEREELQRLFGADADLRFRQQPEEKLEYIQSLQAKGARVMMIGDGLNDAGALQQSDVGVAVSEDTAAFSPACDAIVEAEALPRLPQFLRYSRAALAVVWASYAISFLYNLVGLTFAVSGRLSPVIAAVLMPLSSISVVGFTTLATGVLAKRLGADE